MNFLAIQSLNTNIKVNLFSKVCQAPVSVGHLKMEGSLIFSILMAAKCFGIAVSRVDMKWVDSDFKFFAFLVLVPT